MVLTDVVYGNSYSLADYDFANITSITLQLDGEIGHGFGGCVVMGSWASQNSYDRANLTADNTIEITITNPQDRMTIYNYWGSMSLVSVTLHYN